MSSAITNKPSPPESNELDLGRFIGELIDHRKLIVFVTLIFAALSVIYALLATPIYQANSLIQVEQNQGNSILSSLSQVLPNVQPQSAPEIVLLQSRMVLGKTVDDLNLQTIIEEKSFPVIGRGWDRLTGKAQGKVEVSHFYLPTTTPGVDPDITLTVISNTKYRLTVGDTLIEGMVGEKITKDSISIKIDSINAEVGDEFDITYQTKLEAITALLKAFSVDEQGKDTGMLTLTLTGDDPVLTTKILKNISENYLEQNIERQAAQDAKSLDFLNQQLPKVRTDLDNSEDKLNSYRRQKDSVDLSLEAKSVLDQIVNVENQLNELTFREAEISQLFTKEHPTYKALLEKQETLNKERINLNKKVSAMPSTQQEVIRLSRDVESGRAVYMQLLNRQQELSIAKSSAIGNVRIVDSAIANPKPIKPQKILIVLAVTMFGMIVAVSGVLMKVFLRRGIESPEQLEEMGISVYANVPVSDWLVKKQNEKLSSKNKDKFGLLAAHNPTDIVIETLRSLRTSLHFAMIGAKNNILMISGASPNAGKTFISSNLASVISQADKKVLFIDADMRKGYAHKMFDDKNDFGLSELLSGEDSFVKGIRKVESSGFDYITRGAIPPNPAELLMTSRFEALLKFASENYDIVIVDTPPILAVTDAATIGRYAGTTLIVARFEENTPKEIEVSYRRFEQGGVVVKGCILNGVVKKAGSYYGYGYNHYEYDYSTKD
ncbi:polysaccharide biosynthesis tyrosine autokinase [Erwinia sp. JUb26]|uniref:polysaccharide biosynthesis tyrosine autokinase n=1 Tax=Erwinia sp. JUb26 TaxID=2485126 RepID=UPI000F4ACD8A|nr:polysaccharide biosynthesis tyrosine autokinase [Erwinia sp. JUb26]ROR07730.1 tyrosine-protein kinase Etk/Wzc [Erwinia sp. JUb26]